MKRSSLVPKYILIAAALFVGAAMQSCSKSPSSSLAGTWIVRSAHADTSNHSEKALDAVVSAGNLAQGATITFAADSLTFTVPPNMVPHSRPYIILANNSQIMIKHADGSLDTLDFKLSMDTLLELDHPSRGITMKLARSAMQ